MKITLEAVEGACVWIIVSVGMVLGGRGGRVIVRKAVDRGVW